MSPITGHSTLRLHNEFRVHVFLARVFFVVLVLQPLGPAFASEDVAIEPTVEVAMTEVVIETEVYDDVNIQDEEVEIVEEILEETKVTIGENSEQLNSELKEETPATQTNEAFETDLSNATSTSIVDTDEYVEPVTIEEVLDVATTTEDIVDVIEEQVLDIENSTTTNEFESTFSTTTIGDEILSDTDVKESESDIIGESEIDDQSISTTTEETQSTSTDAVVEDAEKETEINNTTTPSETDVEEETTETIEIVATSTKKSDIIENNDNTLNIDNAADNQESQSYVNSSQNKYNFSTEECMSVGDGAFYCNDTEDTNKLLEDKVYAAPDQDGDSEIYVRIDGVDNKITDNQYDDLAPYYDQLSGRIVWHALMNGRYQIMSYLLETGEVTQLTNDSYNNMEPTAYGNITVWQAWVKNNWEVLLYDGIETRQISDNEGHDIAPNIRGTNVIWQIQQGGEWYVSVYDMESDTTEIIESDEGAELLNPRFVLVYDSKSANGDVRTLGYDFDSKATIPLSALPVSFPDEVPNPEQTGEVRALIQNKPPTEEDIVISTPDIDGDGNEPPPSTKLVATSTLITEVDDPVLVVLPYEDAVTSTPLSEDVAQTEEINPLVISPIRIPAETGSSTVHIEDVVISDTPPEVTE